MYRAFGLTRSPFAGVADGELYWESGERARLRTAALDTLREGRSLWLTGPPGSGRGTFLERLADELALEGRRVLWIDPPAPTSAAGLLGALLQAAGRTVVSEGLLPAAEALYGLLARSFAEAGACTCFPGSEPLTKPALWEAQLIAGLRIAGTAVASVAVCGSDDPPFPAWIEVSLPAFSPAEIQDCLAHRAAACGRPDLLAPESLAQIAASSRGIGDAIILARRELARQAFWASATALKTDTPESPPQPLFDFREVSEVGRLLDSLIPEE